MMIFFTMLGIGIVALLGYLFLFGIGVVMVWKDSEDDAPYCGALIAGLVISFLLVTFICNPESYGYQKITVSENAVEVKE